MSIRLNKVYRRQKPMAEINITPFTDVVLVLLVIFMVTTPLMTQSVIKVKLPEANSGLPVVRDQHPKAFVTITSEGLIYLDDKIVTRKELKENLTRMHTSNPELGVIMRVDRSVRFKDVVEVLDSLNELAITKLDIETLTHNLH